jgi:hypothetical protein
MSPAAAPPFITLSAATASSPNTGSISIDFLDLKIAANYTPPMHSRIKAKSGKMRAA